MVKKLMILLIAFSPLMVKAEKAEVIDVEAQAKRAFLDGLFMLKRKKYDKAADKFKLAIEKQPKLAEAHNNYAFAIRQVAPENYEESLKHYGIALQLKPRLAVAYQYRGCLHTLMGNLDLAKKDYQALIKLGEKDLAAQLATFVKENGMNPKEGGVALSY